MLNISLQNRLKGAGNSVSILDDSHIDLTSKESLDSRLKSIEPHFVFFTGAHWYGLIEHKRRPADIHLELIQVHANVISACKKHNIKKMLFVSGSCIYPPDKKKGMKEETLMTGQLEPFSEPTSLARISGMKLMQYFNQQYQTNYVSAVLTNMYGPHDDFNRDTGHVLPALINVFHEAKAKGKTVISLYGTGNPKREWIYADDAADACVYLMDTYNSPEPINVGVGDDISIRNLANLVSGIVGYTGEVIWDDTKPDGAMRKMLDSSKLFKMGWQPKVALAEGIERTYEWYRTTVS